MYQIKIIDIREHGLTGFIEVDVRAIKQDGNVITEGPLKTYGTDANRLKTQHDGNVMNWLMTVKNAHQAHAGLHDSVVTQLKGLKGTIL
jgi:hypothetical protein